MFRVWKEEVRDAQSSQSALLVRDVSADKAPSPAPQEKGQETEKGEVARAEAVS